VQVWNVLHSARWKYRMQKSPLGHHRTTLSGYIFAIKACIDNRKKNLLSSNISSPCPHNMANFGTLAAEIVLLVWGTPANFNGFHVLAALLHGTLVVGVSQTLRRWTKGATYIRQGGHHVGHWPTFLVPYWLIITHSSPKHAVLRSCTPALSQYWNIVKFLFYKSGSRSSLESNKVLLHWRPAPFHISCKLFLANSGNCLATGCVCEHVMVMWLNAKWIELVYGVRVTTETATLY